MIPLIVFMVTASEPGDFADIQFKDWRVACDNVRQCRAGAATPMPGGLVDSGPEGPTDTSLLIDRSGDPDAAAVVRIEQSGRRAERLAWHGAQDWIALQALDSFNVPASDASKLLTAMKREQSLDLLDKTGRKIGAISLAGANAALLWIDDKQHRIGTTTALIRSGGIPSSSIPKPPPLPVVHAARPSRVAALTPPMAVRRALAKASSCDFGASPNDIEFDRLDAHHTMALLICPESTDNPVGDVSVIDDTKPSQPTSPEIPLTDGQSWSWTPESHTLEDGMISHGFDCSYRDVFVWTGSAFETKEKFEICPDSGKFFEYRARVVYDR